MKLIEREIGLEIELKENKVSVIVIENTTIRLSLIEELYAQITGNDGNWFLVENEKKYDLAKNIELILEPFSLQLNNKKVKTKLIQDLRVIAEEYFYTQGLELYSSMCNFLENVLEKSAYPIQYKEEWNFSELFKMFNVELEEEYENGFDKLFNYVKLVNQVCATKIFVMLNVKQYLLEEQLVELYKLAQYSKIQLVLIEFNVSNPKLECEDVYVLDKDKCIIVY